MASSSSDVEDEPKNYTIVKKISRRVKKFDVRGYDYKIRVKNFDRDLTLPEASVFLHNIISGNVTLANLNGFSIFKKAFKAYNLSKLVANLGFNLGVKRYR